MRANGCEPPAPQFSTLCRPIDPERPIEPGARGDVWIRLSQR